jgi:hypothetical protein
VLAAMPLVALTMVTLARSVAAAAASATLAVIVPLPRDGTKQGEEEQGCC